MEYPGILAWMVRGCTDWQSMGLGTASAVKSATTKYQGDMDVLGEFFEECCVILPNAKVQSSLLYTAYTNWAKARGEKHPLSNRGFSMRLEERGQFERHKNNRGAIWYGIGLLSTNNENDELPNDKSDACDACDAYSESFPMEEESEDFSENPSQASLPSLSHDKLSEPTTPCPHCKRKVKWWYEPLAYDYKGGWTCTLCRRVIPA